MYCGANDADTCGHTSFQLSWTTRSAARRTAVCSCTSGRASIASATAAAGASNTGIGSGIERTVGGDGEAERLLRAAQRQMGRLEQRLASGDDLRGAQVIQPAADAAFEPLAGVVEMRARRLERAHVDLDLAMRGNHGEIGLRDADGDLPARLGDRQRRDVDLIARLVDARPAIGGEDRHGDVAAERDLTARLRHPAVEPARRVERHGRDRRADVGSRQRSRDRQLALGAWRSRSSPDQSTGCSPARGAQLHPARSSESPAGCCADAGSAASSVSVRLKAKGPRPKSTRATACA